MSNPQFYPLTTITTIKSMIVHIFPLKDHSAVVNHYYIPIRPLLDDFLKISHEHLHE